MINTDYENLINLLVNDGYLKTSEIIEAFKAIDRADFVSEENKTRAYVNEPLSIGFEQTISQPLTVAFILELLRPRSGEKILEIGAGSGWQTALLAHIVGKESSGKVFAIERIAELKDMAEKNISKCDFVKKGNFEIILGDGSKGYKNEAPFDRIIAAAASGEIPVAWKRQLKINGRIVAPIENSIAVIDKIAKNKYVRKDYFGFSFVPLITK